MTQEISERQRVEAYRKSRRASKMLDEAAQDLGFESVHELTDAARENDIPSDMDDGVKAMGNAHSWLNNGMLENIHPDER